MPFRSAPSAPRSLRWHLMVLVLAALVPMLVLAGFLIARNALDQRAAAEGNLRETAHALMLALDADLTGIVNALEVTALGALSGENPALFQAAATVLQRTHTHWHSVFLTDAWGQPVADTALRRGEPPLAIAPAVREAIIKARPAVSPLAIGPSGTGHHVVLAVPLLRFGMVNGVVGAVLRAERWNGFLAGRRVPEGWIGVIVDQNNTVLARAQDAERHVGRPAPGWFGEAGENAVEGIASGRSLDGHMITMAYRRSAVTGWTLGFTAPESALDEPLYHGLTVALLSGAALIAGAALLAVRAGRRIAAPIRALTEAAAALEDGRPMPTLRPAGVREIDDLAAAIANAGGRLREARAERAFLLTDEARRREAETQ